jgi:sulfopyruvate decarboxylase subunit beta
VLIGVHLWLTIWIMGIMDLGPMILNDDHWPQFHDHHDPDGYSTGPAPVPMTHHEALEVLAAQRGQHLVITTHGSIDLWKSLSDSPLDFSYVPVSMGQGPALGLGLALAQSRHGVVVVTGDGSVLMNLGCLVTLANHSADVFLIIMDNGVYEVTGGQPTAGAGHADFAGLARAAGIRRVYHCKTAQQWHDVAAEAMSGRGPVAVWLEVTPRLGQCAPITARPMPEQIARLRQALGAYAQEA